MFMNFEQTIAKFEEKLSLERIYDIIKMADGQTIPLSPINNHQIEITINKKTKGYLLDRVGNGPKYEVFVIKKFFSKPIFWVFKRTGEYINNKQFKDMKQALNWMIDAYVLDAEIKLNLKGRDL